MEEKIKELAIQAKKVRAAIMEQWDKTEEFNCDIDVIEEAARELESTASALGYIPLR